MRDPHVESLRYRFITSENVTYDQPSSLDVEDPEFSGRLENGVLTCYMKKHYSSIRDAEKVVEPYLRAWEIWADLNRGRKEIHFKRLPEEAKVVDRNPPPPGSPVVIQPHNAYAATTSETAILHVTRREYPEPPKNFTWSPEVETLWNRFEMYRDGKELLLSMAYFCLTVVEIIGAPGLKGRQRREVASKLFNIDVDILNKLGALTSERGDRTTARKARPSQVPLSDREQAWIEAAIKMLVVRVGEYSSGQPLSQIIMAHLPFLAP